MNVLISCQLKKSKHKLHNDKVNRVVKWNNLKSIWLRKKSMGNKNKQIISGRFKAKYKVTKVTKWKAKIIKWNLKKHKNCMSLTRDTS